MKCDTQIKWILLKEKLPEEPSNSIIAPVNANRQANFVFNVQQHGNENGNIPLRNDADGFIEANNLVPPPQPQGQDLREDPNDAEGLFPGEDEEDGEEVPPHLHSLFTTQFQCQTHEPAGDLITRLHEKMQRH